MLRALSDCEWNFKHKQTNCYILGRSLFLPDIYLEHFVKFFRIFSTPNFSSKMLYPLKIWWIFSDPFRTLSILITLFKALFYEVEIFSDPAKFYSKNFTLLLILTPSGNLVEKRPTPYCIENPDFCHNYFFYFIGKNFCDFDILDVREHFYR